MSLVSWLYRIARLGADVNAIKSGSGKKILRRGKNKYVGRKIWPKINKFP